MTPTFKPHWDILPVGQKRLWPQLRKAAALGFVLYGGTAIALRLGHRTSVDFDFFSEKPVDRDAIKAAFPFMARATSLLDKGDTWSVLVPCGDSGQDSVHLSFFGSIGFGRAGQPDVSEDGILQVASLEDLMATKVKVVLQRAEAKDYRDIAAMIDAGVSLAHGLATARLIFGPTFQPSESLKALVYFEDGDLHTLTETEKSGLIGAVTAVGDLPKVALLSRQLTDVVHAASHRIVPVSNPGG